jgi:hypothetical protein
VLRARLRCAVRELTHWSWGVHRHLWTHKKLIYLKPRSAWKARLRHFFIKELTTCPWCSDFWKGPLLQDAESVESNWFINMRSKFDRKSKYSGDSPTLIRPACQEIFRTESVRDKTSRFSKLIYLKNKQYWRNGVNERPTDRLHESCSNTLKALFGGATILKVSISH